MNSKQVFTIIGILILVLCISVGGYFAYNQGLFSLEQDPTITPKKVKITNIGNDQFTVSWLTDSATQGSIVYGQQGKLDQVQLDDNDQLTGQNQPHKLHHVTITNIQSATTYSFKIKSGDKNIQFDNNGEAYTVKTAPTLGSQPPTDMINGRVNLSNNKPAEGAIIYVSIPGITPLSTQVKKDGTWLLSLANARSVKLTEYAQYDPKNTIIDITIQGESQISKVTTNTANDSPVPLITLGQTYDFTTIADQPTTTTVEEDMMEASPSVETSEEVSIEPPSEPDTESSSSARLAESFPQEPEQNPVDTVPVSIVNPSSDNEKLYTQLPEFLGEGPANKVLTIKIDNSATTGTVVVDSEGAWTYSPSSNLVLGAHTLTVDYTNSQGTAESLTRKFIVAASGVGGTDTPAFEATPSATATPIVRTIMPATTSGTPTSGVSFPTYVMLLLGAILLLSGVYTKYMILKQ